MAILMLQTRDMENRNKNIKVLNCKHCWMKMICKHKYNSHSNWELLKLFLIPYERWEILRRQFGRWVPYELNNRQLEKHKKTCESLLTQYKRKWFLHSIVNDEKVGLGVMCLSWDTRFRGSNPAEVDEIFQDIKILSTSPPGGTLTLSDLNLFKEIKKKSKFKT